MCASFSLWPIPIPFYHISFSGDGFSLTTKCATVGKFLFILVMQLFDTFIKQSLFRILRQMSIEYLMI